MDKLQELETRIENIELYLESFEKEDDTWQEDEQVDVLEDEHVV